MTKTKKTTRSKKIPAAQRVGVVNVKTTSAGRKRLLANARKYAKGNLSAWIRHAGTRYTPKRGEKVSLDIA